MGKVSDDDHLEDDPGTVAVDDVPFDPMSIRDPLPQPLFSLRRLVIALALVLVAVLGVLMVRSGEGRETDTGDGTAIASYLPAPGGRVLRQSEVGVVLDDGWDGRLTINGVAIPEEQMVGAVDPSSPEYDPEVGPRPNTKSTVKFQPGPGKVITEYGTGSLDITVTYWRIVDGRSTSASTIYKVTVF